MHPPLPFKQRAAAVTARDGLKYPDGPESVDRYLLFSRELELRSSSDTLKLAVVGNGRLGSALSGALRSAGLTVTGPHGHGYSGAGDDALLLCVPDSEIASAASAVAAGPFVGHCSGATGLEPLLPHPAFSLHPLMTITAAGARFAGAAAAVDASTPEALALATRLAEALSMVPVQLSPADRPLYHAAASVASNFLVTLEVTAERLADRAGVRREHLVPLVRATVENWAEMGSDALTGPIARRDHETVERQREAIKAHAGHVLPLFDAMVAATRAL